MKQKSPGRSIEDIRLSAKLRLQFEQVLKKGADFSDEFIGDIGKYSQYISLAFTEVFSTHEWLDWSDENKIDIVTWHYLTRHKKFSPSPVPEYFSGQFVSNPPLKDQIMRHRLKLEPYPGVPSPYIEIFGDEAVREGRGQGGPVCILLPAKEGPEPEEWAGRALSVPPSITASLLQFPDHPGNVGPLNDSHLGTIQARDQAFVDRLVKWLNNSGVQEVDVPLQALNYLLASLKVTLNLLRDPLDCGLPRSVFLSPAYLGGEQLGGMAFSCNGLVSRKAVLIGETISNVLLSYLRLREDAQAHIIIEQQRELDEAKRFFIHRLSHDFRHPIDSLQSTVADVSKLSSVMQKQIMQINQIVDGTILAIEGRDPKTLLLPKKREDKLFEFLADLQLYFRKQFSDNHKEFIVDRVNREWVIYLDAGMVHEILENLIVNAIEHGGTATRLFVERYPEKYLFHVQDNGPGISERQRELLFRPIVNPAQPEKERRGRGLAIARMLAEAHGGTLHLGPSDDRWRTHFVLELPIDHRSDKK